MGGGSLDWALHLNVSAPVCLDCGDMRPPPDDILAIPPPPLPAFLQLAPPGANGSGGGGVGAQSAAAAPCSVQCDWSSAPGLEYVELTRRGPVIDDTWLLVLIASCVGVLLLGALLALILLRFRVERGGKSALAIDASSLPRCKAPRTCEAVLYPAPAASPDGRALWATLTPRGTTHHYTAEPPPPAAAPSAVSSATAASSSFENCGFVDSDDAAQQGCYALGQLGAETPAGSSSPPPPPPRRSPKTTGRPRVSRPTRIEHPNLPPLNLHPRPRAPRRPRRDSEASATSASSAVVL